MLNYKSTRGHGDALRSAEAIIRGIAADGGLFVPESIPRVNPAYITSLLPLSYEARATRILSLFLQDYTAAEVTDCIHRAYGGDKFDSEKRAPLNVLDDISVLELFHGPTSAFKDMALQLLPQLMSTALQKTGEKEDVLILVATSGDTGKAALEGFAGVDHISIEVFYPDGGVSPIQRLQMVTQEGDNTCVTAVRGNFDDAQTGVKRIFTDKATADALHQKGIRLSSANSINWGRLAPQIVYYFSAYVDLLAAGRITQGEEINFTVPTGNFGDILAGYYAKRMGLPIGRLVCASNANNVLTDFLRTGTYDRNRDFYQTISPSMDILISSNLERLLYHMTEDSAQVSGWMTSLKETGKYSVGDLSEKIQEIFWADCADDETTKATIKEVFDKYHYVPDTHTAVAWRVAENYQKETGDAREMVVVSTASPYKFAPSVLSALGESTEGDPFTLLRRLEKVAGTKAPRGLASLENKSVRHDGICGKDEMTKAVLDFAARRAR